MERTLLTLSTAILLIGGTRAQSTPPKVDIALRWESDLSVRTDSVALANGAKVSGHAFNVYECSRSQTASNWSDLMKQLGASSQSSGGLMTSTGLRMRDLSDSILIIVARADEQRKQGYTRVSMAVMQGGQALPDGNGVTNTVRDWCVKMNRAVVQAQVDKWLGEQQRAQRDLQNAQEKMQRAEQDRTRANGDLERAKRDQESAQKDIDNVGKEVDFLNDMYKKTLDEKTLKKLDKKRDELLKAQKTMSKALEDQSDAQRDVNKMEENHRAATQAQETATQRKEEVDKVVTALQEKLDAIK